MVKQKKDLKFLLENCYLAYIINILQEQKRKIKTFVSLIR